MQPKYKHNETVHLVTPLRQLDDQWIAVDGHTLRARVYWRGAHELELTIDGKTRTAYAAQSGNHLFIHLDGRVWRLLAIDEFDNSGSGGGDGGTAALAPMPGVVVEIYAKVGQQVAPGDALLLIESMKLQSEIKAKTAGVISRIAVTTGASFERNAVLVEIVAEGCPT